MSNTGDDFSEVELSVTDDTEKLTISVDGFEGPLDLLLSLARDQKVDLAKISILKLAEQYLEFIEAARRMNLELAADYLVMASWLAYLKSRLLLPQIKTDEDEPTAGEMALRLRWRLQRLEAIRKLSARLMARNRLGLDVFARGMPESIRTVRKTEYTDTLYDLLTAYGTGRAKSMRSADYHLPTPPVIQIEEARIRLARMLGQIPEWRGLRKIVPSEWTKGLRRNSAIASTLLACLECARDGRLELRQMAPFEEIYVKDKAKTAS